MTDHTTKRKSNNTGIPLFRNISFFSIFIQTIHLIYSIYYLFYLLPSLFKLFSSFSSFNSNNGDDTKENNLINNPFYLNEQNELKKYEILFKFIILIIIGIISGLIYDNLILGITPTLLRFSKQKNVERTNLFLNLQKIRFILHIFSLPYLFFVCCIIITMDFHLNNFYTMFFRVITFIISSYLSFSGLIHFKIKLQSYLYYELDEKTNFIYSTISLFRKDKKEVMKFIFTPLFVCFSSLIIALYGYYFNNKITSFKYIIFGSICEILLAGIPFYKILSKGIHGLLMNFGEIIYMQCFYWYLVERT